MFGTDGVRGIANEELKPEFALKLGQAAAVVLARSSHHRPKILIGKDTRISSDMLEAALSAGLCSVGADVVLLGVIPTPAVAYLVQKYGADAGVVISASHNPYDSNGIKFFNGDGFKLSDALEDEIEAAIKSGCERFLKSGGEIGKIQYDTRAADHYISYLKSTCDIDLGGIKAVFDCANGAASTTAGKLFSALGVRATLIHDDPNGTNINDQCGSTHMESLAQAVTAAKANIGIAFDGDADRMLAVTEQGDLIDGDKILALFARQMKEDGCLKNNTLVVTTMSNMGLFEMAREAGIDVATTGVGDRYVLEEMERCGHCIGGEQSGHIILRDYSTTGDGQLAAVQLLKLMARSHKKASALAAVMERFPQVIINVRVTNSYKETYLSDSELLDKIREHEALLGENGRIVVRASGTEPLIRVMAEGKLFDQISHAAQEIAAIIEAHSRA
nr:phosphoglucosamine mutase [Feifania hominis]